MRPLIRTARCWLLRARVRAMATLPMPPPAAAISFTTRPLYSPSSRSHRLLLARFFSVAPASAGARGLRAAASAVEVGGVKIAREDVVKEDDPTNNVPDTIFSKIGLQLHRRDNHPLGILKNTIYNYFDKNFTGQFDKFDDLCPLVSVKQNFDDVLVPSDHVSRSYNDTYYVDGQTVLRCHTSAHQAELLRDGHTHFLVTGDVYRRDSIDSTHYPVFHQMEGFRVFSPDEWSGSGMDGTAYAAAELKKILEGLTRHLFGAVEMRWVDTYFPFTNPSFELEIYFQDDWLEVLGCGVTEKEILKRNGRRDHVAWAFGLGLERLAMVLFDIPDIRLFWSNDKRFTSQFSEGKLGVKFKPFSKFPPCYKDMSFWINDAFTENNLCEVVRGIAGDLVEEKQNARGSEMHNRRIAQPPYSQRRPDARTVQVEARFKRRQPNGGREVRAEAVGRRRRGPSNDLLVETGWWRPVESQRGPSDRRRDGDPSTALRQRGKARGSRAEAAAPSISSLGKQRPGGCSLSLSLFSLEKNFRLRAGRFHGRLANW